LLGIGPSQVGLERGFDTEEVADDLLTFAAYLPEDVFRVVYVRGLGDVPVVAEDLGDCGEL